MATNYNIHNLQHFLFRLHYTNILQIANGLLYQAQYNIPFLLKGAIEDPQAKVLHQALHPVTLFGIQELTDP